MSSNRPRVISITIVLVIWGKILFFGLIPKGLTGTADLDIPRKMKVLRREVLVPPWKNVQVNRFFFVDVGLNFIAFVPFGFFAVAALTQLGGRLNARAFHLAAPIGIITSLLIELSQCWLPSRSSTLLDLILNSLGTGAGVALYGIFQRRSGRLSL